MKENSLSTASNNVIIMNQDNIDTDQIIPARFLKTINKQGLGDHLFADWRYDNEGNLNSDFILNQPGAEKAEILLTGSNFGCGSSREHAPWALKAYGFKAVVATSFADIFKNNAVKNGLLPVQISEDSHDILIDTMEEINEPKMTIDLLSEMIVLPTGVQLTFQIDAFSKRCILDGIDEMDYLLASMSEIEHFENSRTNR